MRLDKTHMMLILTEIEICTLPYINDPTLDKTFACLINRKKDQIRTRRCRIMV